MNVAVSNLKDIFCICINTSVSYEYIAIRKLLFTFLISNNTAYTCRPTTAYGFHPCIHITVHESNLLQLYLYLVLFKEYSTLNNGVALKSGLGVI